MFVFWIIGVILLCILGLFGAVFIPLLIAGLATIAVFALIYAIARDYKEYKDKGDP